jgi:DNA-directed RNA polymerase beta subunit/intein/homing endonuclease
MINETHTWNILGDFFKKKGFVHHQIDSFNNFINTGIQRVIEEEADIIQEQKEQKYTVSFGRAYIPSPSIIEENRMVVNITPSEARQRELTYDSAIHVDITEIFEEEGKEPEIINHQRVMIGRVPVMLRSDICNLSKCTPTEIIKAGECEWDKGGYFIIKGKERVLIGQLRAVYNQCLVLIQKNTEKFKYVCEIRSMSEETGHSVLVQCKIGVDDRTLVFSLPYIKELIPIGIVFKALGYKSEEEIRNLIGIQGEQVEKYIKLIIRDAYFIDDKDSALAYIGQFSIHVIKDSDRKSYALQIVEAELFPHLGITATIKEKSYFLGHMVNRLLSTHIGHRSCDDRDNYANKRVEMAGVLCCDLFRTLFKRYVNTVKTTLEKKKQHPDVINIINKLNSITTGLKHSFSTGNWGVQKNSYIRSGVSQVLSRLTFGAALSHLRRIVIPIGKEAKNTEIRRIHPSQIMYLCPAECFDPSTPILLYDGMTKLAKNIKVGDILIDDKGSPTKVKSICSGLNEMYEIQQNKNCVNYTVTENHILTLKIKRHKTIYYLKKSNNFKLGWFDKEIYKYKYKRFNTFEEAQQCSNELSDDILDIKLQDYLKLSKNIKKNLCGFKKSTYETVNLPTSKSQYSSLKIIKKGVGAFAGWQLEGNGRFLLPDYTVVHNTPEGQSVGIVMNLSLLTTVSERIPTVIIKEVLENSEYLILIRNFEGLNVLTKVFLNGILLGMVEEPDEFIGEVKQYRDADILDKTISIVYDGVDEEIRIFSDEGRLLRPLFTVEERSLTITEEYGIDWNELVRNKHIQYLDNSELEGCVIAMNEKDLVSRYNDFCEISPAMMLGVMASIIPFPDHSQSPRNCYQCLDPDELVVMGDGIRKKICDIQIGDSVVTVDPKTYVQSLTKVINQYIRPSEKKIITLVTESGRLLTSTEDHPVLTSSGWKEASKATDVGIIPQQEIYPFDVEDFYCLSISLPNTSVKDTHISKLEKMGLYPVQNKYLMVLARMIGYLLSDGSAVIYRKYPQIHMTFGSNKGCEEFQQDVESLGFKRNAVFKVSSEDYGNSDQVIYRNAFASLLIGLINNYVGKRNKMEHHPVPEWILNSSKAVKREFLSGFQGGNGCKIRYNVLPDRKNGNFIINSTSQTIMVEYVPSLVLFMGQIISLLKEFGISCSEPVIRKSKNSVMKTVHVYFTNTKQNIVNYVERIGWRYDHYKYSESLPVYEYLRKCLYRINQIKKERVHIQLLSRNMTTTSIANVVKKTTSQVSDILRSIRNNRPSILPNGYISYIEWVKNISVEENIIFVPIEKCIEKRNGFICDISVDSKNHSFIAGDSFCVHNSSMGKQAIGMFAQSHHIRTDTIVHVLDYPQKPLVSTMASQFMGFNNMPSGINAIVAIACYTGLTLVKPLPNSNM